MLKKIIVIAFCIIILSMITACGEWSGGNETSFGFITYTEPLVAEKETDEDGDIWYNQGAEDGLSGYSIVLSDTSYEDADEAAISTSIYEYYATSYADVEETSVAGLPAVSYVFMSEGEKAIYVTEFALDNERMSVKLFGYDENGELSEEGWEVYEDLIDSISIDGVYSDDDYYDDEDYDDYGYDEPSGTVGQENALRSAEDYLSMSTGFSEKSLRDQLEYEGYESEDIDWAIENVDVDWDEQCEKSAKSYMESSSFSAAGLRDQLSYEGFTDEQIEAGLAAVGY